MVTNKIISLLAEIIGVDEGDINEETEFTEDYGIGPIDVTELIITVEEEFNIIIYDDEAIFFESVGDIVNYISDVISS